jgi:hypothetical protein
MWIEWFDCIAFFKGLGEVDKEDWEALKRE